MPSYLADTNILIDFGRDLTVRAKLQDAQQNGTQFVIAPPVLIELVRGLIAGGPELFVKNKEVLIWLYARGCKILNLPRPFMAMVLQSSVGKKSGVMPQHYQQLIEMVVSSTNFDDFLKRSEIPGSVWKGIVHAHRIHEFMLDRELGALVTVAGRGHDKDLPHLLSRTFGVPGCRPNPLILQEHFSAAIEFLASSFRKVRCGAKLRNNDPGVYVDFQLLLYLADPTINFLTQENFSTDIRRSPQRFRIVGLESLDNVHRSTLSIGTLTVGKP